MTNLKKAFAVSGVNFKKSVWIAYLVAGLTVLSSVINSIVAFASQSDNMTQGVGNSFYIILLLSAVLIPAVNFKKIMHLNGRKIDFFWGTFFNYMVLAAVLSAINIICSYTIDSWLVGAHNDIWNISKIFGWTANSLPLVFFQQFAFLLMMATVIHTITALQTFWIGWVLDAVIASILSVFIPIAPLRAVLVSFLQLFTFNPNPIAHITACLLTAVVSYSLNLLILSRKKL